MNVLKYVYHHFPNTSFLNKQYMDGVFLLVHCIQENICYAEHL